MKNYKLLCGVILVLIVILCGIEIGWYIYSINENNFTNNLENSGNNSDNDSIEENTEEKINDVNGNLDSDGKIVYDYSKTLGWINALVIDKEDFKVEVKETNFNDMDLTEKYQALYINDKKIIQESEILEMSSYVSIDKFIVFPNDDLMIQYTENSEGSDSKYFLIYNKGKNYINLEKISKFNNIDEIKVEENKWTISSNESYGFIDLLCSNYKDDDVIYIEETFEYLENGKFKNSMIIDEKTVLDIRKENGYSSCSVEKTS